MWTRTYISVQLSNSPGNVLSFAGGGSRAQKEHLKMANMLGFAAYFLEVDKSYKNIERSIQN